MAPASAAERCAPAVERVRAEAPRYVHAGTPFELVTRDDTSAFEYRADNVVAELLGLRTPIALSAGAETTTLMRAPLHPGPFAVTLTWDQSASATRPATPPCSAQRALPMTALPASARIGDLERPRVDGRWRVLVAPVGWPHTRRAERSTLRYRATCDVGACAFRTGSASWQFGYDGRYHASKPLKADDCILADSGKVLARGGYPVQAFSDLRIAATRPGADGLPLATRLVGEERTVSEPTTYARSKGCTRKYIVRWKVTATRI